MIRAILLDLDNTLYDEHTFVKSGFKAVSKAMARKLDISEDDLYQTLWQTFLKVERNQVFSETLKHFGVFDADLIPEMLEAFRNHYPAISVFEDVYCTLIALKEKFALGLITGGKREVQENKIKALKLDDYFEVVTYAEEYGGKCCPKPFVVTLQKLQVSAEESVLVDDDPLQSFLVAKDLGLITVRMLRGENASLRIDDKRCNPDFEITSLQQLLDVIGCYERSKGNRIDTEGSCQKRLIF
jgi:putative hydrolase of the HAD superfamily